MINSGSSVSALPMNVAGKYFRPTRGNSNKLLVKRCRYELRQIFFSNRIVNMWNSLPGYVVMSDTSVLRSSVLRYVPSNGRSPLPPGCYG